MSGGHEKTSPGETAVLTNVALSNIDPITICYLTVQFEDEQYLGTLLCRDPEVCRTAYQILQEHIGKPINEIGDLDLPDVISNTTVRANTHPRA